ncbi:hypothetical protein DZC73_17065 [Albitalea terrae]|uniref:Uncharacterized protein n=1 Tax=Piscinibacter terrae TaxID=2496871 RepID=A0A3N7HNR0_9BURK|nr:hypothetical protein DZC73_17065 [Albitalea terrae]
MPAGWTAAASSSNAQVYRSSRGTLSAEFRVYPAQQSDGTLSDWFETRRTQPMAGVPTSSFEPTNQSQSNIVFAYGAGVDAQGRRVIVVRTGCARSQGGFVLAETVMSMDLDYFRQTFQEAGSILEQACFANGTAAATKAAPATKPAAEPPAERPYAYVKAQGTGLKPKDIETILWRWRNEQSGMTMQVRTYYYLLLKDGTYRHGLPPVALEDFDAAAAKQGEPQEWGRWTRSGANYALRRNGDKDVDSLPADSARLPARKDEKLDGTWQIETAYSSLWSVSRSRRAISFDRDGRFSRNSGGSIVGSMGSGAGGNAVGGSVVHDDDSSSSSMGSAVAVAGSSRKRASTLPDRSGTYRLDGYTLELRYDSGRVERLAFCTTDNRDTLYFNGEELRREKPDKR